MGKKIRKGSDLYQEALIWMGYRYAIGLTESSKAVEKYKLFRDIEYDTPEFHVLAGEITNYLRRKKVKEVVDLRNRLQESDLIWYSAHYGINRHSYAASHCHDIVLFGREVLSPERKEFIAHDIRRELADKLHVGLDFRIPFGLQDNHDPIDYLMTFLQQNKIFTDKQLEEYKWIEVKDNSDGTVSYYFEKTTENNRYHMDIFTAFDFWDYLGWADLASYFDPKSHKLCKTRYNGEDKVIKYFDSWIPIKSSMTELSYRKEKRPVDSYKMNPSHSISLREEFIIEDNI